MHLSWFPHSLTRIAGKNTSRQRGKIWNFASFDAKTGKVLVWRNSERKIQNQTSPKKKMYEIKKLFLDCCSIPRNNSCDDDFLNPEKHFSNGLIFWKPILKRFRIFKKWGHFPYSLRLCDQSRLNYIGISLFFPDKRTNNVLQGENFIEMIINVIRQDRTSDMQKWIILQSLKNGDLILCQAFVWYLINSIVTEWITIMPYFPWSNFTHRIVIF